MNCNKELSWNELNHSYQPSDFSFRTTDEVQVMDELIGQEDAIEAIKRGLRIKSKGYNIYICDTNSKRMDEAIIKEVQKVASKQKAPLATGYVYNFHHPETPLFISLEVKDAISLRDDLEELQAFIQNDIPILLDADEVQKKQEVIEEEFDILKEKYFLQIEDKAEENHILSKRTNDGIQFVPLNAKGEVISKKDFLSLSLEEQNALMEKVLQVQEYADEIMEVIEKQEKVYAQLYEEVIQEVALREIGAVMKKLLDKYDAYQSVKQYFNCIAEDLVKNLDSIARTQSEHAEAKKDLSMLLMDQGIEKILKNYAFNLMTIPTENGAPIIVDYDYPQLNLGGKILLDTEGNVMMSDYRHIRPGLFQYANGGYLILHMKELLEKANGWQSLKHMLRTESIRIEGSEELGIALSHSLRPETIKADIKVILIGNSQYYEALSNYDEEFKNFFKVKVNFKDEVQCDKLQIEKLAGVIKCISQQENLLPVSVEGLLKLIEMGNRQTDHPKRMPANIEQIVDILREAQWYATNQVEVKDIEACLADREKYERYLQERLDESINDATYLLDTKGSRVGQVNGLAVYSVGDLMFGRPVRITATTYRGKQGIVDIENEAKLSGAIHTKGIHIISGFLGNQFAQEIPLSLSCNLCFEQSYVPIDGDSASSTELYAILSSLSEMPIMQNIAVTGSVNQFGEIQPIGGVNEKIEGFFKVCKQRGLAGNEGVIIPKQNIKELILKTEVIEAVKNQQFHIYAIGDIWEGVEILMKEPREKIIAKVEEKLKKYNE